MFATADPGRRQALAEALHLLFGRHAQRIVGLDAKHEVHAALEIEPELQGLRLEPAGRGRPYRAATSG